MAVDGAFSVRLLQCLAIVAHATLEPLFGSAACVAFSARLRGICADGRNDCRRAVLILWASTSQRAPFLLMWRLWSRLSHSAGAIIFCLRHDRDVDVYWCLRCCHSMAPILALDMEVSTDLVCSIPIRQGGFPASSRRSGRIPHLASETLSDALTCRACL